MGVARGVGPDRATGQDKMEAGARWGRCGPDESRGQMGVEKGGSRWMWNQMGGQGCCQTVVRARWGQRVGRWEQEPDGPDMSAVRGDGPQGVGIIPLIW